MKVESALSAEGAQMITSMSQKLGSITVDRELVTGSNPMAANSTGAKVVEMLKGN